MKTTLVDAYMDPSSELTLDEASFACPSSFSRDFFFNSQKPSGKFHFHFHMYMLCCISTYACMQLCIHMNESDIGNVRHDQIPMPKAVSQVRSVDTYTRHNEDSDDEAGVQNW